LAEFEGWSLKFSEFIEVFKVSEVFEVVVFEVWQSFKSLVNYMEL
jgi:hypothetical protein